MVFMANKNLLINGMEDIEHKLNHLMVRQLVVLGVRDIDWNKRPNDCHIKQEILTINDETKN